MVFGDKVVLRGLEQRLHESVYYTAERVLFYGSSAFSFFSGGRAVRG